MQEEQFRQHLRQSYPGAHGVAPGDNQAPLQAGPGGSAGCRLRDLCYEDKAKVAKLIKQVRCCRGKEGGEADGSV